MRKALSCARLWLRLYIRSGRIVFPLLALIGYPLLFYHVLPVDTASSFSMSAVQAFAWGAWVAIAALWSENETLRQLLMVKAGTARYPLAQKLYLMLTGAAGGVFLVALPMLAHALYLPEMFAVPPTAAETALGLLLNACAGICGAAFGALFHPRLVRDRKAAYLLCLLLGLLGLVDGMAGLPLPLRLLLPPMYDAITGLTDVTRWTAAVVPLYALWFLAYAAACTAIQTVFLQRRGE